MLTKLDAVNQLLDAIGESPVSSLSSGLPDAEKAERFLDRITKEVLEKGWDCNRDAEYTMSRDANNRIRVASTMLRVDTSAEDADTDVTVRVLASDGQRYLYDKEEKSFTFTKDLTCEVVWSFDFEDLTFALQNYIAAHAARRYQESTMGSVALDSFVKRAEDEAWAAVQDAEAEAEDSNVLTQSPHCRSIVARNNWRYGR